MVNKYFFLIPMITFAFVLQMNANIYCPPDKTINCNDDRHYLPLTGTPVVFGYPQQILRYSDETYLNNCNAGYVLRRWFIDVNQDGVWQSNEGSCIQTIYIVYIGQPVEVYFPPDRTFSCKEDIVNDKPTWLSGPCDVMGYSVKDDIFEIAPDACYKIMRTFTVINWCTYNPGSSGWNGSGKWVHKQIIKVVDQEAPVIDQCEHLVFNTQSDCKAEIKLEKLAFDNESCPSLVLSWVAEIDLWANGTIDYRYGFTESGVYYIAPVSNGTKISFTLPERVAVGKHKVKWSVRDQCGNFRTCNSTFEVKDLKPPTPYMHVFLTSSFRADQMDLMIPARMFNINSFDNCTHQNKLKYSFSPDVNDTIRVVGCGNVGFQFFTIYVTDLEGNADFAEVFMLVFDNGTCSFTHDFQGRILHSDGRPLDQTIIELHLNDEVEMLSRSGIDGIFSFSEIGLMKDYHLKVHPGDWEKPDVNVVDFIKLKDHLFGSDTLKHFELVAADMDKDNQIRINDLKLLRSAILEPSRLNHHTTEWRFLADVKEPISESNMSFLKEQPGLMDYDGNFDFSAVYSGDISGALQPESEFRSSFLLSAVSEAESISLIVEKDMEAKGLQLELGLPGSRISDVIPYMNGVPLSANQYSIDDENNIIRVLLTDNLSLSSGDELVKLVGYEHSSVMLSAGHNVLVTRSGEVFNIRLNNNPAANQVLHVFPNPSTGTFTLSDSNVHIHRVFDLNGKSVEFLLSNGQVIITSSPGVYFLQGIRDEKPVTLKLVLTR